MNLETKFCITALTNLSLSGFNKIMPTIFSIMSISSRCTQIHYIVDMTICIVICLFVLLLLLLFVLLLYFNVLIVVLHIFAVVLSCLSMVAHVYCR